MQMLGKHLIKLRSLESLDLGSITILYGISVKGKSTYHNLLTSVFTEFKHISNLRKLILGNLLIMYCE